MEAEKLLEQAGFSKIYESRNIVAFVSGKDMFKFYKDSEGVSICNDACSTKSKCVKTVFIS